MKTIFTLLCLAFIVFQTCALGKENALEAGNVAARNGNEKLAIAKFSEAIKSDPKNPALYQRRGDFYFLCVKYEKTIADHTEAIRLDPKNPKHYNDRGNAYRHLHEYKKAITDHTEAIRLAPKSSSGYFWRAFAYQHDGEYGKAVADFIASENCEPKGNQNTCNMIAELLASCHDPHVRNGIKALKYALKSCKLSGWRNPFNIDTLAAAYAEAGDFKKAVKWEKYFIQISAPGASKADYTKEAKRRLALYEAHKPYHRKPNDGK